MNFGIFGFPGAWREMPLKRVTIAQRLTLPITFQNGFDAILFRLRQMFPVADGATLSCRVGLGKVLTGANYQYHTTNLKAGTATYSSFTSASATELWLAGNVGNAVGEGYDGDLYLSAPSLPIQNLMRALGICLASDGLAVGACFFGNCTTAGPLDTIEFAFSGGAIKEGYIDVIGLRAQ